MTERLIKAFLEFACCATLAVIVIVAAEVTHRLSGFDPLPPIGYVLSAHVGLRLSARIVAKATSGRGGSR
jgi:hypothetical protein